jgi:peptide/nickel transport system substrate-binding protein
MYHSFTPGQQSVFVRNPHYFKPGLPHLDQLTIIDFSADTAAFNALQSGQLHVYSQATLTLMNQVKNSSTIKALVSLPGQWTPFTMRVDTPPFNDARVRQAFRLLLNRPELINVSLDGFGSVGNDVFSQWDPCYARNLHREQDIPQAKSLLKQAGHSNLAVQLVTADFAAGVVQAAQVFAQQAKAAGVTVNVKQVPVGTFYGPNYLRWPFAQDFWAYSPYLSQVAQGSLSKSPFNETHWNDPAYVALYTKERISKPTRFRLCGDVAQVRVGEECPDQPRELLEPPQGADGLGFQVLLAGDAGLSDPVMLDVFPDPFIGVELG